MVVVVAQTPSSSTLFRGLLNPGWPGRGVSQGPASDAGSEQLSDVWKPRGVEDVGGIDGLYIAN